MIKETSNYKRKIWFANKPRITKYYFDTEFKQALTSKWYFLFREIPFKTIHIKLERDLEEIRSDFKKVTKYEIAKSFKLAFNYIVLNSIDEILILHKFNSIVPEDYYELTNRFKNNVVFTFLTDEFHRPIVSHVYIIDESNGVTRLLKSNLSKNPDFIKITSVANRRCHFEDIGYFKELGFKIYDLGGVSHETNNIKLNNINFFKSTLGGIEVKNSGYVALPSLVKFKRIIVRFCSNYLFTKN